MAEEFDLLAAKVLSGEATESERARFEQLLSADPECRAEFEELRKLWPRLKEVAPVTEAWEATPEAPPAEKVRQWRDRVESRLGERQERRSSALIGLALAAVLVAAALIGLVFMRASKDRNSRIPAGLQTALSKSPDGMRGLLVSVRNGKAIPIYAPAGFTAEITPTLLWKTAPGRTYDVSITDELVTASQPFRLRSVLPPVDFAKAWPRRTLTRDGLYRLQVSETGNSLVASEITFRVLPEATASVSKNAAAKVERAYELLAADPPRMGDALTILLNLPPEQANSERALRLKAFAFGQLGYADDFEAALRQLRSLR
jgi:hypothetical protein